MCCVCDRPAASLNQQPTATHLVWAVALQGHLWRCWVGDGHTLDGGEAGHQQVAQALGGRRDKV
jgi:hypothetical protein